MRVGAVMDELGVALSTIDGLRVFPYGAKRIVPPAAVVGWPDPIRFDETIARGLDYMTFPILIATGDLDARSARDVLAAYLDGAGASSVKAALEAGTYTACDSVRATEARIDPVTIAGIPYLAAVVDVAVYGTGRT